MNKKVKISLVVVIFSFLLLGMSPTQVVGQRYRSDYEDASQKIYEQIHNFNFIFDSTNLSYGIYFGAMFISYNSTLRQFVADVFVITLTGEYVGPLTAALEYSISVSYNGNLSEHSDTGIDSTSIVQFGDLLYNYSVHSFLISRGAFPVNVDIDLEYNFTSSEFSESESFYASKQFTLPSSEDGLGIPGYFIASLLSTVALSVLIITMIFKKKKLPKSKN